MASHGEQDRFRRHLWAVARTVGGDEIEISRDPLHKRYEVNRHSVNIDTETFQQAESVQKGMLKALKEAGWNVRGDGHVTTEEHPSVYASINVPMDLSEMGAGGRVHIYIGGRNGR